MQVNIDEVNATRRKLAVEVPVEEVTAEFDRAFGRVQKQAKLKGFRPGRAPRSVVEKLFGPVSVTVRLWRTVPLIDTVAVIPPVLMVKLTVVVEPELTVWLDEVPLAAAYA